MDKKLVGILRNTEQELKRHISPKGALGLPALLDKRRLEHDIPDEAFDVSCLFDRILLFQVGDMEGDTYGDTSIVMPDAVRERERDTAPRGVLIGAGLSALDVLASNGIELGHIVTFMRISPLRMRIGIYGGYTAWALVMQVGDLTGSVDLAEKLKKGQRSIVFDDGQHKIADGRGKAIKPKNPWIPPDL